MAARRSDKAESAGRYLRARDKWKQVTKTLEKDAERMQKTVATLETERFRLRSKAELLSVLVEDEDSTPLERLQQLEQHVQQLLKVAGEADSSRSNRQLLYGNVNTEPMHYSTALLISLFKPEWIHKVLSMSNEEIVARLRELVNKSAVHAVQTQCWQDLPSSALLMNTQIAAAQPPATAANEWWRKEEQPPHQPHQQVAMQVPAAELHRDGGQHHQQSPFPQQLHLGHTAACTSRLHVHSYQQQEQQQEQIERRVAAAGARRSAQHCNSAASMTSFQSHRSTTQLHPHTSGSCSSAGPATSAQALSASVMADAAAAAAVPPPVEGALPPPLEYVSIVMTLMLMDEQKFMAIQCCNLEDMTLMDLMPPEFWTSIASKLELAPEQVDLLHCMSELMDETLAPLFKCLGDTAQEGLEVTQLQEQQQAQQQLPQKQQELLHAQATLLQKQRQTLQQWQIWGLQMGILSINTLTVHQMGLLQVLSYPNCPRMDMVLKDLAAQPPCTQQ